MNTRLKLILLIVIVALIPAWFFNRYMQQLIQPRNSGKRLLLYLLIILAFVTAYTFLVVWIILKIFPVPFGPQPLS